MKTFYRLTILLILIGLLSACGAAAVPGPAAEQPAAEQPAAEEPAAGDTGSEKPVVGLVMKSLANEFFKTMEEGAQKYAQERGDFELIAVGMNSETDIDTQINAVEGFITQGVDMIVLAPADSAGLVPSVKKAIEAPLILLVIVMMSSRSQAELMLRLFQDSQAILSESRGSSASSGLASKSIPNASPHFR